MPPTLHHEHLPQETTSVPAARLIVRRHLHGWPGDGQIVELLASELATNAVTHAQSGFTLTVIVRPNIARVEVVDDSADIPAPPTEPPPYAVAGRGLALVETLSTRWGAEPVAEGKRMWFEVEVSAVENTTP